MVQLKLTKLILPGTVLFLLTFPSMGWTLELEPNQILDENHSKLDSGLLKGKDSRADYPNMIIEFVGGNCGAYQNYQTYLTTADPGTTRGSKIKSFVDFVRLDLRGVQYNTIRFLLERGLQYTELWAERELYVVGMNPDIKAELEMNAANFNIRRVREVIVLDFPNKASKGSPVNPYEGPPPWHLQHIGARCADINCNGEGVLVAIIDTGVNMSLPALSNNYKGGVNGWFDPLNKSKLPSDIHGGGTRAAGVAFGADFGVANNAKWIACLAFPKSKTEEIVLKWCGQWAICPDLYDMDGVEQPVNSCDGAPHIINFSWAFDDSELVRLPKNFFYKTIQAWNAGGFISNFPAGNDGPYCSSIGYPAAFPISFAIGAVDSTDTVFLRSSRGPMRSLRYDPEVEGCENGTDSCQNYCNGLLDTGSQRQVCTLIKPDLTAPGVDILAPSIKTDTGYEIVNGTYIATAVVSGVAALMICANDGVPGAQPLNQTVFTQILKDTAFKMEINVAEGNVQGKMTNWANIAYKMCDLRYQNCEKFPNNSYGNGIVNACAAVQYIKGGGGRNVN